MHIQRQQPTTWNRPQGPDPQGAGNAQTRFSGISGGWVNRLADIFQPITEQFVYGFTAQDVVALWIPRDATALTRSRDAYDVRQDPAMQGKHPLHQWFYSVYRNIKGLNYSNAWEETLREVETGPGLLIAQSLLLGAGSATLIGKLSIMMGHDDLKAYSDALSKMLKSPTLAQAFKTYQHRPELAEKLLQQRFLSRLFHGGHFQSGLDKRLPVAAILKNIDATQADDANRHLINLLKLARKDKPLNQVTYREALNTWIARWTAINPNAPKSVYLKQIDSLEAALKRMTYWFNDNIKKIKAPSLVNKLNIPALGNHPHQVEHVVENLRKFRPFITDATKLSLKDIESVALGDRPRAFLNSMSKAVTKLFRSVAIRKAGLSLAATLLAGWVVVTVSAIAQAGKAYPANKKFMLNNGGKDEGQQGGHGAPHFQGSQVRHGQQTQQQTAISRQFSQPVSFVEPAAVSFAPNGKGGAR